MENWEKWNLKYAIAEFAVPRLKAYKSEVEKGNNISIPTWIIDKSSTFDQDHEYTDEEIKKLNEQWIKILEKMIFTFDSLLNPINDMELEELQNRQNEGIKLFGKYYFNLWD